MPRPKRGTHTVRCTAPGHKAVGVYVIDNVMRGQAEARAVASYIADCEQEAERWFPPRPVPDWRDVEAEHL